MNVLIRGGRVVDGSLSPARLADIRIENGRIVAVESTARLEAADEVIDASGLLVCPGFIDVHTHDDLAAIYDTALLSKLSQGVTTCIVGNCGLAPTPCRADTRDALQTYVEPVLGTWPSEEFGFPTYADYLARLETVQRTLNIGGLAAHGSLRIAVMGFSDKKATATEIREMQSILEESLNAGAFGLSLGLMYAPGCFAAMDELIALAETVAQHGGVVASHIRGEGDLLIPSIEEMLTIAETTKVPVHISHLKAVGRHNWGTVQTAIDLIRSAQKRGLDVTCDAYPYAAGSTTLLSLLPPWVLVGGVTKTLERLADEHTKNRVRADLRTSGDGWDNVAWMTGFDRVVLTEGAGAGVHYIGKTIHDIAVELALSHEDAYLHVIEACNGRGTIVIHHMNEADVKDVLKFEPTLVGSDGLPSPTGHPHPRLYGTFPRFLAKYVRDEGLLSLEQAVFKATASAASRFGLEKRGLLAPGYVADLVLLDFDELQDKATYQSPREFADGIRMVMVGGDIVLRDQQWTKATPGRTLRHETTNHLA